MSRLDLVVDQGKVKETNYQLLDVDPEKYPPDPRMLALIAEQRAPFSAELDKAIGATRSTLVRYYVIENPMDNLITDAMMWKLKPDVAVSNGFRFGPPIVADERHPAVITNDHLHQRFGFDSDWIVKRTGILERRHALPHQATSDLCLEAAAWELALMNRNEKSTTMKQSSAASIFA